MKDKGKTAHEKKKINTIRRVLLHVSNENQGWGE